MDRSIRKGVLIVEEFEYEPCESDFSSAYVTGSLFNFEQDNNINISSKHQPSQIQCEIHVFTQVHLYLDLQQCRALSVAMVFLQHKMGVTPLYRRIFNRDFIYS